MESCSENSRIGAYRLIELIGRGGMGAVYLAARDDDQYRKQVALKIVKPGMDTDEVLRHFRQERQILAGLEHPYIARLLDGGSTGDGRPFLVMELVGGQPITEYCRGRKLGVDARCRLFLKVCEAVAFAHRKLVVHRDLKPANILITAEGLPKLLDFGLAKILDGEGDGESTRNPFGSLTPEYASPEQMVGGPLSTASDIYSLGVILNELLTGRRRSEDARGSRLRLPGDLENIVQLALRAEADRRYGSVDEFAADIRNYLELRPVHARPDSLWYRAGKFARRRRYSLLAGAGVLASLVGAMSIALGQAHAAESARRLAVARQSEALRARQAADAEHRHAEAERDRAVESRHTAEERVTQMVDLSDRSLSQVYGLMERLAGGMAARRELIGTTLDFLEKLSADAGSDIRLRIALAKAYTRLGDIQQDPSGAALGGWPGALQSYRAGSALLENSLDAGTRDALLAWLDLEDKIGLLLGQLGRVSEAPPLLRRAIAVVDREGGETPDKDLARRRACLYLTLSKETHRNFAGARPYTETSIAILSALAQKYPADAEIRYDLSRAYTERGYLLANTEGAPAAQSDYEKTVDLREALVRERPTDAPYRRVLVGAYDHAARNAIGRHELDEAREYYRKGLAVAEVDAADRQNLQAVGDYGTLLLDLAELEERTSDEAAALDNLHHAIAEFEAVAAASRNSSFAMYLAEACQHLGKQLSRRGLASEAIANFRRSQSVTESYAMAYPGDLGAWQRVATAWGALIDAWTATGDRQNALDGANALLDRMQQSVSREIEAAPRESLVARAYLALAGVNLGFGDWAAAHAAAQEAVKHANASTDARLQEAARKQETECAIHLNGGQG